MRNFTNLSYLLIALLIGACSGSSQVTSEQRQEPQSTAPYYTSSFPHKDLSQELRQIQQSVIRITATGYYRSHLIRNPDVTRDQISGMDLKEASLETMQTEESTAGTAIALAQTNNSALLLTCAHVIQFPDTVVKYRKGDDVPSKTFVESVTIKTGQTNFALNLPALAEFKILAMDDIKDLALLEIDLNRNDKIDINPIRLTMGNSKNLRLGSFIYILGYPKGYSMVTRAIVGDPDRTGNGDFVTDALFNRGISGGLVIASKNNFRNFEWVGVASSAAANNEFVLVPNRDEIDYSERLQPYDGSIYVEQRSNLVYGITQAVSTNKIYDFLEEHRDKIRGYRLRIDRAGFSN